jgi:hypothetical protein
MSVFKYHAFIFLDRPPPWHTEQESLDFLVYSTVPVRQIETACVLSLNYLFINTILAMQRAHWMHRSSS